jgi:NAD-dependent DNA ligase
MPRRIYVLRRPGKLDAHGQPTISDWNAPRVAERSIDELIGICKGLIADRSLSEEEVYFLTNWLKANEHTTNVWPANVLAARITQILDDKILLAEEREDLFTLLADIVGQAKGGQITNTSTALPLTRPAPPVFFTEHRFVLTGRFVMGQRANVAYEIQQRGGSIQDTVTNETNFLVIGTIGNRDWVHSTHGRKIEKAMALMESGRPIAIISEEHLADHFL